jgi:hypothetical protein
MPKRIQLSRKKGFKLPANTVNVARPSKWGNPYKVGVDFQTAQECVDEYRRAFGDDGFAKGVIDPEELRGKDLACWCGDGPCHADVLLELANR